MVLAPALLGFGVGLVSLLVSFGVLGDKPGAAFGIAGVFVGAALTALADRLLLLGRNRSRDVGVDRRREHD
jgi:predicted PurR-regulated permease PerM